jgi:hypothetical protein
MGVPRGGLIAGAVVLRDECDMALVDVLPYRKIALVPPAMHNKGRRSVYCCLLPLKRNHVPRVVPVLRQNLQARRRRRRNAAKRTRKHTLGRSAEFSR